MVPEASGRSRTIQILRLEGRPGSASGIPATSLARMTSFLPIPRVEMVTWPSRGSDRQTTNGMAAAILAPRPCEPLVREATLELVDVLDSNLTIPSMVFSANPSPLSCTLSASSEIWL